MNKMPVLFFVIFFNIHACAQNVFAFAIRRGCEEGAGAAANNAVAFAKVANKVIESTKPNTKERKDGLRTVQELYEQHQDQLYVKTKTDINNSEKYINEMTDRDEYSKYYTKNALKIQSEAFEIGAIKALRLGINDGYNQIITRSETYYKRSAENECLSSYKVN